MCGCGVNVQIGGGRAPWAVCGGHRCNKPTPSAFIGGVGLLQPAAVITSCLCVGCRVSLLFYLWACVSWLVAGDASFLLFLLYVHTHGFALHARSTVPQRYVHARTPRRCGTVRTPMCYTMQSGLVQCIALGYMHPFSPSGAQRKSPRPRAVWRETGRVAAPVPVHHTRIRHHCPSASRELVAASIGVFHHAAAAVTV